LPSSERVKVWPHTDMLLVLPSVSSCSVLVRAGVTVIGVVQLVPAFQDSSALRSQLLLEPLFGASLARSWSSTPPMVCVWLAAGVGINEVPVG